MNFVHLISNKEWGGGETYALELCRSLRADGHACSVFTRNRPTISEPFAANGLLAGTMAMRGPLGAIFGPVRLASYLNRLSGDTIIHTHNFKDASIALNARRLAQQKEGIRVVATRHLVKPANTNLSHTQIYNELDGIIFVSELARDTFLSTQPQIRDSSRLHVVRNSTSAPPFDGVKTADGPVNIIYSGRIAKEKGLDILIDALGRVADLDWKLTVCGSGKGSDVMPIVRAARSLGINDRIDWKGHVGDVFPDLQKAHIAVMPSICQEAFGLSALEAMSQGCAVVATNNGAQREFLADGATALLVEPSNAPALAEAIKKLILDRQLRATISANALEAFKRELSYKNFYESTFRALTQNRQQ